MCGIKAICVVIFATVWSTSETLAQTFWQAGTGDWFSGSNWTLGVPAAPGDAVIANGGTAQIQAPGASVRRLRVGRTEGPGNLQVDGGALNVTENLHLNEGGSGLATLAIQGGGSVTSPATIFGFSAGGTSSATITGMNSTLSSNALWVGTGGTANLNIENTGTVFVTNDLSINNSSIVNLNGGTLRYNTISGTGGLSKINFTSGTIRLAGNRAFSQFAGGDLTIGTLFGFPPNIPSGKTLYIEGIGTIFDVDTTTVSVNGGELISTNFDVSQGMLSVLNGGTVSTSGNGKIGLNLAGPHPKATVSGFGSSWTANNLNVGDASLATLTIGDQGLVFVNNALTVNGNGTVNLNGGTLRFNSASALNRINFSTGTIQLAGNRNVGTDAAITQFYGAAPVISTGKNLTVEGTATLSKRLRIDGGKFKTKGLDLTTQGAELDFYRGVLEVEDGPILGVDNLIIPTLGELHIRGVHSQRITGLAGSTIKSTADVTIGSNQPNGFYTNGTILVGDSHTVTLTDANDAVLDSASFVRLNDGGNPGTLAASNGLTLNFGGNIFGEGAVQTPNDPAKPFINNGNVSGQAPLSPVNLTGYVKGVGAFDNVQFTGTFSPGFSPARVNLGSATYDGTLAIELGGTTAGSGYDQLNHILGSGVVDLGGTLDVSLINGFQPEVGQFFPFITSIGGIFNNFELVNLPALGSGKSLRLVYGETIVGLQVVSGLPGDFDLDGDVDGRDFLVWQRGGSPNPLGAADLAAWQTNYGAPLAAIFTAVPEPGSLMLVSAVIMILRSLEGRARDFD